MTRLSVNLNKIALLRNSRHTGVPDIASFARLAIKAGAAGITVHPRPDERHIRASDVPVLASLIASVRPTFELNIEGRPAARLMELIEAVKPEQCTLVPDAPAAFTSEKGWDLTDPEIAELRPVIERLHRLGSRVILFMDPDPKPVARAPQTGADGIEIYTGIYASAFRHGAYDAELKACIATAEAARSAGLMVNAGHDLNLHNLPPLVDRIDYLAEVSIGHELTADALVSGFEAAIAAYKNALKGSRAAQVA
ncbi:MAG TPA: pyridoxine 5'-phosphate synthase [Candidatus Binataceae bacterium]|nr:pyridoxine 5'-phosphate synthase [Candidatus Binataceae bacterium]